MKKYLTSSIAAAMALGAMVSAGPAAAQYRDSDRDGRPDRAEWNRDRDRDGRPDQYDRYDNRRDRHVGRDRYDRPRTWRYYGGNYGYNGYDGRWRSGQRYPYWRDNSNYISDWRHYGLPAPRRGYRYYRADNGDVVMVAIASGIIGLIIGGALAR